MSYNYYENVSNAPYYENVCEICDDYGLISCMCPINYPVQDFVCENFYPNHFISPSYPSYGWENESYNFLSNLTPPNEFCNYPTYGNSTEEELENIWFEFMQYQMEFNAQVPDNFLKLVINLIH